MNKVQVSQSLLMELYNTPSETLSFPELVKKLNEKTGNSFSAQTVKAIYENQLNVRLVKRPRKASKVSEQVEVIFDMNMSQNGCNEPTEELSANTSSSEEDYDNNGIVDQEEELVVEAKGW